MARPLWGWVVTRYARHYKGEARKEKLAAAKEWCELPRDVRLLFALDCCERAILFSEKNGAILKDWIISIHQRQRTMFELYRKPVRHNAHAGNYYNIARAVLLCTVTRGGKRTDDEVEQDVRLMTEFYDVSLWEACRAAGRAIINARVKVEKMTPAKSEQMEKAWHNQRLAFIRWCYQLSPARFDGFSRDPSMKGYISVTDDRGYCLEGQESLFDVAAL